MRAHMENMDLLLRLDSNEVRMIGIWGPSGIGKSTIARVLFNQHSHNFPLSVFMENIKRDYPRPCFDRYSAQLQLQKELLSRITNHEDLSIRHLGVVQDRLKDKKVLVVLDDVDQSAQLDALAKVPSWFGPGSRIIVTTQDKRILKAHQINPIYEVGFPHDDEALEIFCMNAFGQKSPYDGFLSLAREVTSLAGKLPLGLSVMGSYFKGLPMEEWEHELPRLRTRLDGEIESILKFSYEVLCDEEQDLFLHIACFFNDERIDKVQECLAHNLRSVKSHLHTLVERSLISVDWGRIQMHDLLALLGRDIVRKQSPNDPGQRQFLVDNGDICQVLRDDTLGSRSVIAINLIEWDNKLEVSDRVFDRMNNVQFLRIGSKSHFVLESLNCLPREVRLLHLEHFPMTCLPSNFNTEFLVEIYMPYSKLEKLWGGNKMIGNLKWMNMSDSENLKELPDLSTATNLLELNLSNCSSLVELPFSIGNMTKLKILDLFGCSSLVELPSSIGNMTKLKQFTLDGCSSLVELSSSIGNMSDLKDLKIIRCSSIVKLPSSIVNMTNLKNLNLTGCSSLVKLPSSIGNMTNLENLTLDGCSRLVELSSSIGNMANLKDLDIVRCSSIVELPFSIGNMTNLKNLNLHGCSSLVKLPSSIGNMTNLKNLDLRGCSSLVELPSSIGNMTNLENLILRKCLSLANLPSSIGGMTNLKKLDLKRCSSIVKLPSSIGNMTNLPMLSLQNCSSLVELPSSIGNMTNLKNLQLHNCSSLVELPCSIGNITNLKDLSLSRCSSLVELPYSIGNLINLENLCLGDCSNLVELPSSIGDMTNIKDLSLYGCSSLVELPSSIGNMTHLKKFKPCSCSNLVELPFSIGNMTNLQEMFFTRCSSLVELPSSIGNMTNLKKLSLFECTTLVKLPSSIGNITNLEYLNLDRCSSLGELPSSIGNMTNLVYLQLGYCSSLIKLPSSIGNLHDLKCLCLNGCSKLKALPININFKSLDELDLSDCSSLKRFPEISTNISVLKLNGTAIEEIPPSIRSWSRLERFHMPYSENLRKSQHAFDLIKKLHLSDPGIQEIAPWVKEMSRLRKLVIKGCTKLVSLPQLPDSLKFIDAENCESLERLDCSFYRIKFSELSFVNCFKLNQEARDLIIKTSTERWAVFPGEKVPTCFSYKATGSSVSMKLNGLDTQFPTSLRFKACVVLVTKSSDVEWDPRIYYCIKDKLSGVKVNSGCRSLWGILSPQSKHLVVIEYEETVISSPELVFDFRFDNEDWEIKECGLHPLESLAPSMLIEADETFRIGF